MALGRQDTLHRWAVDAAGKLCLGEQEIAMRPDGTSAYVTNGFGWPTVSQYSVAANGTLSPKSPATIATGRGPSGGIALGPAHGHRPTRCPRSPPGPGF